LREKVPEIKFDVVHGQMKSSAIEKVMLRFLENKFEVLIATKIIEAGIDIPNVNTIFIYNAHTFGLAEIYQLRGRVGRSNRQAYAYLIIPPVETIGTNAVRRLIAIEEFTELGSGLNLALKDMEIRGIGNLFGKEQKGFINSIGFDMYCRVLDEAIAELKEQEFGDIFREKRKKSWNGTEPVISAEISAYIPESYIDWDAERFNYYRKLYEAETPDEVERIREEMEDRFGRCPDEVDNLILIAKIRTLSRGGGISKVEFLSEGNIIIHPSDRILNSTAFRSFTELLSRNTQSKMESRGGRTRFIIKFKYVASMKQILIKFIDLLRELNAELSDYQDDLSTYP
jgi:transcription-repair coupling factor (superfamily II helicase)